MVSRNLDRVSKRPPRRLQNTQTAKVFRRCRGYIAASDRLAVKSFVSCAAAYVMVLSVVCLQQSQRNDMSRCCELLLVPGCLLSAPDTQGGGSRELHTVAVILGYSSVVGCMDSNGGGRRGGGRNARQGSS